MVDLMKILCEQDYSCIELDDDTRLVTRKINSSDPGRQYESGWLNMSLSRYGDYDDLPEYMKFAHYGETAKQSIEAALESRYK